MKIGADIGGTKTLLEARAGAFTLLRQRYENDDFESFEAVLIAFLEQLHEKHPAPVTGACFAVAAPIHGGVAQLTNRQHWSIDGDALCDRHQLAQVELVNDFVAVAAGISTLGPTETRLLQQGERQTQALLLALGPGTGLGVAAVQAGHVLPSEGGHIAFSPFDDESFGLWQWLGGPWQRINGERILCGRGLVDCYRHGAGAPDAVITAAQVVRLAGEGDALAASAVRLFARCFGAVAGDLAMVFLARGGVCLAGGITPRLPPHLFDEPFMSRFLAKDEHAGLVARFPVLAVTVDDLGLRGALAIATQLS